MLVFKVSPHNFLQADAAIPPIVHCGRKTDLHARTQSVNAGEARPITGPPQTT